MSACFRIWHVLPALDMDVQRLDPDNYGSPYAEQLKRGFRGLRFGGLLEKEFREFYVGQNLPRARLSGLIALILVLAVTCIDLLLGASTVGTLNTLRLGVLCPLLVVLGVAISVPGGAALLHRGRRRRRHADRLRRDLHRAPRRAGGLLVRARGPRARRALRLLVPRLAVQRRRRDRGHPGRGALRHGHRGRLAVRCAVLQHGDLGRRGRDRRHLDLQPRARAAHELSRDALAERARGARRHDGPLQPPHLRRLHRAALAAVAARGHRRRDHFRRYRLLQALQRSLRSPSRRRLLEARCEVHRARRETAVRFRGALRRRGVRARAVRPARRVRAHACPSRFAATCSSSRSRTPARKRRST